MTRKFYAISKKIKIKFSNGDLCEAIGVIKEEDDNFYLAIVMEDGEVCPIKDNETSFEVNES